MARSKEAQEAYEELMQSLKNFQERVKRMPPEERKVHDQKMKELYAWLYPGEEYLSELETEET